MENTKTNKAKFFALHYGQKVLRWHQWAKETDNGIVHMITPMASGLCSVDDGWFLQLKSLQSITDEEAQKLGYNNKDVAIEILKHNVSFRSEADKLRELGYLIGYNGLTPDQIIFYGWAKI